MAVLRKGQKLLCLWQEGEVQKRVFMQGRLDTEHFFLKMHEFDLRVPEKRVWKEKNLEAALTWIEAQLEMIALEIKWRMEAKEKERLERESVMKELESLVGRKSLDDRNLIVGLPGIGLEFEVHSRAAVEMTVTSDIETIKKTIEFLNQCSSPEYSHC